MFNVLSARQSSYVVCSTAAIFFSVGLRADPLPENQTDAIYSFLKDHVVYKKFKLKSNPCENGIVGTDIQCEFARTTTFANLSRSENVIKYNVIYDVAQTNRLPQPDGSLLEQNKDRVAVMECELRAMRSENAPEGLVGICQTTANSLVEIGGSANAIQLTMSGDQLIQSVATVGFSDCFANNAVGYRLCSGENHSVTESKDGKMRILTSSVTFHITNAVTGERQVAGDAEEYLDEEM